jgi:hypothetical protein
MTIAVRPGSQGVWSVWTRGPPIPESAKFFTDQAVVERVTTDGWYTAPAILDLVATSSQQEKLVVATGVLRVGEGAGLRVRRCCLITVRPSSGLHPTAADGL